MKTMQYKVTLLSDLILNQKAATEGPNSTLDYIPGNCFLGIVASQLYKDGDDNMIPLFHSNAVRFGDAHPSHSGVRCLRVPAAMYYPKLGSTSDVYISYLIPQDEDTKAKIRDIQLKQCRNGFYDFTNENAIQVNTETSFAIKSAHDCETRASKNNAMYGYESLHKGLEMLFSIEVEQDSLADQIHQSIIGIHHIGRSRSAQYGLVEIVPYEFKEITSNLGKGGNIVYADGRLIFLDENGMPTFRPTAEQLGIKGGIINWEKSQVRTFRYANWNGKRQCFDTDRCGIEKGSVFVIDGGQNINHSNYVGNYTNEGFGQVIYNPSFLQANPQNGKALYHLQHSVEIPQNKQKKVEINTPLLKFLDRQKQAEEHTNNMYSFVNKWVEQNAHHFTSKTFASQWGTIRALASLKKDTKSIELQLFEPQKGYLMHGIGQEKWEEYGRRNIFKNFVMELYEQFEYEEDVRMAIVNLAAEMAKQCKKEGK